MIYNVGSGAGGSAENIQYDNTESGLQATNVQDAVDELNNNLGDISDIKTSTLNSVAKLLQYWIDNSELSNPKLIPLVPKMTSNTTPYGECIKSSEYNPTVNPAYKVFDGDTDTSWISNSTSMAYIGYKFVNSVNVKKANFTMKARTSPEQVGRNYTAILQGSNNGTNWTNISESISVSVMPVLVDYSISTSNSNNYLYYRIYFDGTSDTHNMGCLQFYGEA